MPSKSLSEPSFLTCWSCSRKSCKVNSSALIFLTIFSAVFASIVDCAFSIKLSTSPMPRIRDAMRSGWKISNASNFSPMPTNFIGQPVAAFIESAAPPRASPSSLVKTIPSTPSALWKVSATLTASWPIIESTTNKISCGLTVALMSLSSCIKRSSIWSRPAVSIIRTSRACLFAKVIESLAIWTASFISSVKTGTSACAPTTCNCLIAAGR